MAEIGGNGFNVHAVLQSKSGIGVAEIVEPDLWEPHGRDDLFELFVHRACSQMSAKLVCEHESLWILIGRAVQKLPLILL